jgi:hypothetical protein
MRREVGPLASLALIGAMVPASAFAGGVFFGFGGGAGDVSFDGDAFADNFVLSDDSFVGEWEVGYRFDSKLVIEGGGTLGLSLDFFFLGDFFSLSDERVLVGYAFQPSERFSIVPKLGVSRWHLDTESGTAFVFGSERADFHDSGSDLIWRVSGEWRVAERLHLYGAYSEAHYSFGSSSGPSFGFKFQF